MLLHEMVVEEVSPDAAKVVYAVGECKPWGIAPGWSRHRGQFRDDGSMQLEFRREGGDVLVLYRPTADFMELHGFYHYQGRITEGVFRRVS
jgi:hypothetical protein